MSSKQRIKRSLNGEEIIAKNKNVNQNEAGSSEPAAKKHKGANEDEFEDQSLTDPVDNGHITVKQEPGQVMDTDSMENVNYEILLSNEFYGVDPMELKAKEESWCSCAPPAKGELGCQENCDNRAKRIECDIMLCKAGDQCGNRSMQLQSQPLLAVTEAGVVVTHDLTMDTFIGQYTGQLMSRDMFEEKLRTEYINTGNLKLHVMPLNDDLVIDATIKGSICRLAGHSCSPNTVIKVWKVEGLDCLAMYCLTDLHVNDVVTFDHSPEIEYLGSSKRCRCGSRNCRQILGKVAAARGPLKCGSCQTKLLEPGQSGDVLLHPELATPVCQQCCQAHTAFTWAAGDQEVCRWCVKPGKLVSCDTCAKSFCKNCLKNNLGPAYIKLAEHGSWTCVLCDTSPLGKIRDMLWVTGEQERPPAAAPVSRQVRSGVRPAAPRLATPGTPRPVVVSRPVAPGLRTPGVRPVRPATPRTRMPASRQGTPSNVRGVRAAGTPFPVRMLGQSSVSIERVPRPAAPPPKQVQQRTQQTAAIINQLQRYSGLSIQPVSESASQLENLVKEVEQVYRVLHDACNEARKISKDAGLSVAKDRLSEGIRLARSKLSETESKF